MVCTGKNLLGKRKETSPDVNEFFNVQKKIFNFKNKFLKQNDSKNFKYEKNQVNILNNFRRMGRVLLQRQERAAMTQNSK